VDISVTVFARVRVCVWVCTVTDFSAGDKASRVKFCMLVHLRPGQGISHFGNFAPQTPKIGRIGLPPEVKFIMGRPTANVTPFVEYRAACGRE